MSRKMDSGIRRDDDILDVLVLGCGFAGMHMLYELRDNGMSVIALEAGGSVGGAWYWNRYPGARCDVESLVYCYSFSPIIDREWEWSERYATQPEIRRYADFVCDRLDLRKDIVFDSRLVRASFDETTHLWTFNTERGDVYRAHHFVSAAGPISAPIWPDIPGRETFQGDLYHTAMWPQTETDFAGKRVGVIGTGSSGIQLIPIVAEQAEHLTAFIRTPSFYANANNRQLTEDDRVWWEANRSKVRSKLKKHEIVGSGDIMMSDEMLNTRHHLGSEYSPQQRREILERRWEIGGATMPRAFADILTNHELNEEVCDFLREKIAELVDDPVTAEILTPRDIYFGTRRVVVGTNFYQTFNRSNVSAVGVKETPIERFTAKGLVVDGKEHEFDVIICASGFDALTGALTAIHVEGVAGKTIKEAWSQGCDTYLGIGLSGFPNLHIIGGPGSPSVLLNVMLANEYQVGWISNFIKYMSDNAYDYVDVDPAYEAKWVQTVQDVIKGTVMTSAKSWYVGANVPGKSQGILAYAGGIVNYVSACEDVAKNAYEGFVFKRVANAKTLGSSQHQTEA